MKSLRRFFERLFSSATRQTQEERLREEIDEHIALQTAENLRAGLAPVEARRQAMLKFGGVEAMKQDYRAERGVPLIEDLLGDLRLALRLLRKSPGFTVVAVATLAIAIGANAVVFGVLNALILRPLNVPQPESLYEVKRADTKYPFQSYPDYLDLRDRNRSFDALIANTFAPVGLYTGEIPSRAWVYEVSGNYFDALAIQPYLGRFFHASDEHGPSSAPYIVLTYAYWHTHFQDDRGVVGRTVQLNKYPFTIVGVAPPEFQGTVLFFAPDFFVPIVNAEQIEGSNFFNARATRWVFMTIGHLRAGVTPEQAVADLNSIGAYLEKTYPKEDGKTSFSLARPGLIGDVLGPPMRAFLAGLMLLAALILLAACANLGSLFAARAADRSKEVALRLALGAGRMRILRQLFTEAVLISLLGGAVGLWGSVVALRGLSVWQPFPRFPLHVALNPDANVYGVALLLTIASGFLFGAVPVRQVLHTDPYEIVKSGTITKVGRRITVRDVLIAAQIAICAVMVTSSMVAVRGLIRSLHGNFGFRPENVMLMEAELNMAGYSGDAIPAMQKRMIDAMQTIPGVKLVGVVDDPPLSSGAVRTLVFTDQTTDLRPRNAAAAPFSYIISPEYFDAASTTLQEGRAFIWHDDKNAPRVAVVNRVFARKLFGSEGSAIGGYFKRRDGTRVQIVGVVEDGKYHDLTEDPTPAMFLPMLQSPSSDTWLVVRSNRDPQQLALAMRNTLHDLDAGLPVAILTWNQAMNVVQFPPRMATISLGLLGGMGAMLSITGIFGMAAYSVSKRLRELGIRMALGAQWKEVLKAALGRAIKLLTFGSLAGLLLGILASRVLASIVYQATPRDPIILASVVVAMAMLGLVATWIPAQRALSLDPLILLRDD